MIVEILTDVPHRLLLAYLLVGLLGSGRHILGLVVLRRGIGF